MTMKIGSKEALTFGSGIPPRSRLYCLAPLAVGTLEAESLTSYLNRLAWVYRVSPKVLVAQEILPCLAGAYCIQSFPPTLGQFGRYGAMGINGATEAALDWSNTLEQLTMRSDLRHLTAHAWASGLPTRGLLRDVSPWCFTCYQQWQEQEHPIYQPLMWMLQVVTVCIRHKQKLVERCPSCKKIPSVLASKKTPPGYCNQCDAWLGATPGEMSNLDDETLDWQAWVTNALEELYVASFAFGRFLWGGFSTGIAACIEALGGTRELARMTNIPNFSFSAWQNGKRPASLTSVLEVGYVLDISPVQFLTSDQKRLKDMLQSRVVWKQSRPRPLKVALMDRERVLEFLQGVLDGREAPLAVRQIERRLHLTPKTIFNWFPHEYALITAQYQDYRTKRARERVEQACNEVCKAVLLLHEQGKYPSQDRVKAQLSDPNLMLLRECSDTWRSILQELGLRH